MFLWYSPKEISSGARDRYLADRVFNFHADNPGLISGTSYDSPFRGDP